MLYFSGFASAQLSVLITLGIQIIIIIIIITISFMQGIYTHIPETNYVPREYGVAAILFIIIIIIIIDESE
jgi:hypothetical protein